MPYTTFHSNKTTVIEICRWFKDGTRWICVSYTYCPSTGYLIYAASVLKTNEIEPTEQQINNHDSTTTRRFEIRPVFTNIACGVFGKEILKIIRREMCHGLGCVGPRRQIIRNSESLSSVEMLSDGSEGVEPVEKYCVCRETHAIKTVHSIKYGYIELGTLAAEQKEIQSKSAPSSATQRTIFICFKGSPSTGDLLYGACIHHQDVYSIDSYEEPNINDDYHYETATMRLEKCPVHMNIPDDFVRLQLKKGIHHREDIMYLIIDNIMKRVGGRLQIKRI